MPPPLPSTLLHLASTPLARPPPPASLDDHASPSISGAPAGAISGQPVSRAPDAQRARRPTTPAAGGAFDPLDARQPPPARRLRALVQRTSDQTRACPGSCVPRFLHALASRQALADGRSSACCCGQGPSRPRHVRLADPHAFRPVSSSPVQRLPAGQPSSPLLLARPSLHLKLTTSRSRDRRAGSPSRRCPYARAQVRHGPSATPLFHRVDLSPFVMLTSSDQKRVKKKEAKRRAKANKAARRQASQDAAASRSRPNPHPRRPSLVRQRPSRRGSPSARPVRRRRRLLPPRAGHGPSRSRRSTFPSAGTTCGRSTGPTSTTTSSAPRSPPGRRRAPTTSHRRPSSRTSRSRTRWSQTSCGRSTTDDWRTSLSRARPQRRQRRPCRPGRTVHGRRRRVGAVAVHDVPVRSRLGGRLALGGCF